MANGAGGKSMKAQSVVVRCPSCGAGNAINAGHVGDHAQIVQCRECGTNWPAKPDLRREIVAAKPMRRSVVWSDAKTIDAIRKPLVTFSEAHDPWIDRHDTAPAEAKPAKPQHLLNLGITLLAITFIGIFIGARQLAVAAVPDLAGLYQAVGLPVNVDSFEISAVTGKRRVTSGGESLIVSGLLINTSDTEQTIPSLVISIYDGGGRRVSRSVHSAPLPQLNRGGKVPFAVEIGGISDRADLVKVTLDRTTNPSPPNGLLRESLM